jgi:filamentous hemagglutinin family protein
MKPKPWFFHKTRLFGSPLRYGAPLVIGFAVFISGTQVEARNILRSSGGGGGGAASASTSSGTSPADTPTASNVDAARANANNILRRTNQTLDAIRAVQNAARAAAAAGPNRLGNNLPDVPDGIGVNGLNPHAEAKTNASQWWQGADAPVQTVSGENVNVRVKQNAQQALLHWQTLNVGKKTTLHFDQSAGGANAPQWIAFNQIKDPSANPTQILGTIKAEGQVYLINPNGIIFGGSSTVNARGLTASSLPINTNLIQQGLLNNTKAEFLFNGINNVASSNTPNPYSHEKPTSGKYGDVIVQEGALLESPSNSAKVGGRIALIGANVYNKGTIVTPDGQSIIAAGLQVGIDSHASSDPSLRGLDIYIGAINEVSTETYAGKIIQDGRIEANRGSITLASSDIQQNGALLSTTSVSLNGRIDLLAHYDAKSNPSYNPTNSTSGSPFLFNSSGKIATGESSVIRILPEYDSKETAIGKELALRSQINFASKTSYLGKNSIILAPNASANIIAGAWYSNASRPLPVFKESTGQIYLDDNAEINVAGSIAIPVPVTQNNLTIDLRGAELANSPLQRDAILRGASIKVDIRKSGTNSDGTTWIGTPVADVSGFANLIQRGVGQLTVNGGSVNISSGGSVIMNKGSKIDVSGGSTLYESGIIHTSLLISKGQIFDISDADPNVVYDEFYTGSFVDRNLKFQMTSVYSIPLAKQGKRFVNTYQEGANGGKLSITAPAMALDGSLLGHTITGERQLDSPPKGSELSLSFTAIDTSYTNLPTFSPTPPKITFTQATNQAPANPFVLDENGDPDELLEERKKNVLISEEYFGGNGFASLSINNHDGDIEIPSGTVVKTPDGGSVTLSGSNIVVDGSLISRGGNIMLSAYNQTYAETNRVNTSLPSVNSNRGLIEVGFGAVIDTSGTNVDNRLVSGNIQQGTAFLNGGSISINSISANLAAGSLLNVAGGAAIDPRGKVAYGSGGSISIATGKDLDVSSLLGGSLTLKSNFQGISGSSKAGSFSLSATAIQVGGSTSNPNVTVIEEDFFNRGGFGSFSFTGVGQAADGKGGIAPRMLIAPGTKIKPVVASYIVDASSIVPTSNIVVLEEGKRSTSMLSFNAKGAVNNYDNSIIGLGDVILSENASITTDAKGSVSFNAEVISLAGNVTSRGGTISVSGGSSYLSTNPYYLRPTVLIAGSTKLSTAGVKLNYANAFGLALGDVISGGNINVSGNIVAYQGSVFDVSGSSGVIDMPYAVGSAPNTSVNASLSNQYTRTTIDTNGGQITLSGARMLYSDATLIGHAGGRSANGGSVSVRSGKFIPSGTAYYNTAETNLIVRQVGYLVDEDFTSLPFGTEFRDANGTPMEGIGRFTVSNFSQGGFNSLTLGGNVLFDGPVSISTPGSIRLASGGVIAANDVVNLSSSYIGLGQSFTSPTLPGVNPIIFTQTDPTKGLTTDYYFQPTSGEGRIDFNANLIDVGNLSLQGISMARLNADSGAIRGNGTLGIQGDLKLNAAQIYPTTAGAFNLFSYDLPDWDSLATYKIGQIIYNDGNYWVASKDNKGNTPTTTLAWEQTTLAYDDPEPQNWIGTNSYDEGSVVQHDNKYWVALEKHKGLMPSDSLSWELLDIKNDVTPGTIEIANPLNLKTSLPYSAGGTLSLQAANIIHSGVLRAPIGTIRLGWDGAGNKPLDPIARSTIATPITKSLVLHSESKTSVSAFDPVTGKNLTLPYGMSLDGETWIAPSGVDITTGGAPTKSISIAAENLTTRVGAEIDISGGGDLYAYRWISGKGGTKDILDTSKSFAIIPGHAFNYSPYAPFNTDPAAINLDGDSGYVNSALKVGDSITITGDDTIASGTYTLLPARYALLDGAYLVTPVKGAPVNPVRNALGTLVTSGYRSNNLNPNRSGQTTLERFEISSGSVVRKYSEYADFKANETLKNAAIKRELNIPRLPVDSGYLSFSSSGSMLLSGSILSQAAASGRGAQIDISSTSDIFIGTSASTGTAGTLLLDSGSLSALGAESLLVGGIRTYSSTGVSVKASTSRITVDNSGTSLNGQDVILASNGEISLTDGSSIESNEDETEFETLILGSDEITGGGNGALVRVSANGSGGIIRKGVTSTNNAKLSIGDGVLIAGGGIILDSSSATNLSDSALISSDQITFGSGQISIALDNRSVINPTTGLILAGNTLSTLKATVKNLQLSSYSFIDLYGNGFLAGPKLNQLHFQANALRAFDLGAGDAIIQANEVTFSNTGLDASVALNSTSGTLQVDAHTINLSSGSFSVNGYQDVSLNALDGIVINGKGKFTTNGNLHTQSPFITANSASDYLISATGLLAMDSSGSTAPTTSGLGAKLTIDGSSVIANTRIDLSSGSLNLIAKSGNLEVGGLLSVAGNSKTFKDVIRYTDAGTINLVSSSGNVILTDSSVLSVAAAPEGGNAGTINVKSTNGSFTSGGSLLGTASAKGRSGSFTLDTAYFDSNGPMSLTSVNSVLNTGKFFESRSFRVREGDVFIDNSIKSHKFSLAADSGSIEVSDSIDASGTTGGHISLAAHGSLTLSANAKLTARGNEFDNAGKGGSITLEAGNQRDGVIKTEANLILQTGSTIDLSITSATQSSESLGQFTGVLHLRAPRNSQNNDLAIAPIGSAISDASNIIVEGVKIYDLTNPSSTIDKSTQNQIKDHASGFMGVGYEAMENRLKSLQPALNLVISPGAEIINKSGDLILGSISSTPEEDWNLESYRFGPKGAPGTLTIRAAGDIVFYNSLSDGFKADPNASIGSSSMWLAPLMDYNSQLKSNFQSWNYRITSGSDISSADYKEVFYETLQNQTVGSLKLGKDSGDAISSGNENALTSQQINNSYQVIRTGSGNIDINVAASLQLLNPLASIYTAGTILDNPTKVITDGDFMLPKLDVELNQYTLGINQQIYAAQYTMAGGNINIHAGLNLERKTKNNDGLIDDSARQLPNNWLYRRGKIDADGKYGKITFGSEPEIYEDEIASTTWWVDFSNFFQDIGALGGGNVSLIAGQDVKNISASIPTNARAASGFASIDDIIELGGGDLDVAAGRDIDGGVYYVERGIGKIEAKSKITTNSTRSPSLGLLANLNDPLNPKTMLDANTWLPTTLFVGKSEFIVNASSDLLLGPVTNPFLLPQGLGNKFWYKTYFSTNGQTSQVTATSLGGDVTYRNAVTLRGSFQAEPILKIWHQQQHLISSSTAANRQPWLRIAETNVDSFEPVWRITASNLSINSLSGDVNLVGDFTLFPSAYGQLDVIAADSINGLQPTGISNIISSDKSADYWTYSTINISDADPSEFPTVTSPTTGNRDGSTISYESENDIFLSLYGMLTESGSFTGINSLTQTKQSRHSNNLHRNDNIPLHIYAENGNLSGINLFSSKMAKVFAGNDMVDLSLYVQNINYTDVTTVTSGRDINPYNPNSPLRIKAQTEGNTLPKSNMPLAGDIQISGPGKLEVLAGRNLDLGIGGGGNDGTGSGITSIGNLRNPYLAAQGADVYVSAGIGPAISLSQSSLQYNELIEMFMATAEGNKYLDIISPGTDIDSLNEEERAQLAVNVFQLLLRDAGRNFNNPESPFYGKWDNGWLAIKTLFPESANWNGKILTQSRDIRTKMGGDINITVPGGGIVMSDTSLGNPLAPPGIITEAGGKVSLFTDESVDIGIGRIFTLQGGDITIWSSNGDIAAGSSSRTVQSAPPTRVVIDPQSASVQTDLAGLATGGGIGVLATVEGVKPGDVDLYAPTGVIDAGEAGIRVTGNINLGAVAVVNANNISAGGTSTGAPTTTVSAPSVSTISNASSAAAASSAPAAKTNDEKQSNSQNTTVADTPSIFTVEVIGYGGGTDDEEEKEKNNQNEDIQ